MAPRLETGGHPERISAPRPRPPARLLLPCSPHVAPSHTPRPRELRPGGQGWQRGGGGATHVLGAGRARRRAGGSGAPGHQEGGPGDTRGGSVREEARDGEGRRGHLGRGLSPRRLSSARRGAALRVHAPAPRAAAARSPSEALPLVFPSQLFLPHVKQPRPRPPADLGVCTGVMESKLRGYKGGGSGVTVSDEPPSLPNQALLQKQIPFPSPGLKKKARKKVAEGQRGPAWWICLQSNSKAPPRTPHAFVYIANSIFTFNKCITASGG